MRKYELMLILKPLLPQDIREKVEDKIRETIEADGGKITKTDMWGKRHMSYPINGHEDGYYIVYDLEASPKSIQEVKPKMTLTSEILRYMFIVKK